MVNYLTWGFMCCKKTYDIGMILWFIILPGVSCVVRRLMILG